MHLIIINKIFDILLKTSDIVHISNEDIDIVYDELNFGKDFS